MRVRHLAVGFVVLMATLLLWHLLQPPVRAGGAAVTKKVRISNDTDDTGIRVRCVHFKHEYHFTRDVARGKQVLIEGVDVGDRGLVVYEDLNEEVIATGHFKIEAAGKNIEVKVIGKMGNYTLSYKVFDWHHRTSCHT